VSASVNLPLHHKVQKFSSGTSSPGGSGKRAAKRLWFGVVDWPTMLSVKEFFFTLGVVISFTLGMVNLSVDLSQLGRI